MPLIRRRLLWWWRLPLRKRTLIPRTAKLNPLPMGGWRCSGRPLFSFPTWGDKVAFAGPALAGQGLEVQERAGCHSVVFSTEKWRGGISFGCRPCGKRLPSRAAEPDTLNFGFSRRSTICPSFCRLANCCIQQTAAQPHGPFFLGFRAQKRAEEPAPPSQLLRPFSLQLLNPTCPHRSASPRPPAASSPGTGIPA